MESAATYCGTVYPWQCDHVGHMNIMWYAGKFDEANWNLFADGSKQVLQTKARWQMKRCWMTPHRKWKTLSH